MKRIAGRLLTLAVCGAGEVDERGAEAAAAVGAAVARSGCALVCGGLGGVMTHAARGAQLEREQRGIQGLVIGLLPGERSSAANPYCDLVVPTGLGIGRNLLVIRAAHAVILVGGGAGTLSEAAFAWQTDKPLVALAGSGGWAERLAGELIDQRVRAAVVSASSPTEAVDLALAALEGRS